MECVDQLNEAFKFRRAKKHLSEKNMRETKNKQRKSFRRKKDN